MPASRRQRSALKLNARERRALADELYAVKREVYVGTLRDLAESHGYDVPDELRLGADVERALRDEATEHAAFMVTTFNREVDEFVDRNADLPFAQIADLYETWASDRWDKRAEGIGVSETYGPHADATIAFYAENDLEPEFDFGGHGDAEAQCALCQALEETSPHPMSRVLEVGVPHLQCRQDWHALVDAQQLPDELRLGNRVGGILGADPLNITTGGTDEAVERVRAGASG